MVEVWLNEKEFEKYLKKEKCFGYNSSGKENCEMIRDYSKVFVSVDLIDPEKTKEGKIYIKGKNNEEEIMMPFVTGSGNRGARRCCEP